MESSAVSTLPIPLHTHCWTKRHFNTSEVTASALTMCVCVCVYARAHFDDIILKQILLHVHV